MTVSDHKTSLSSKALPSLNVDVTTVSFDVFDTVLVRNLYRPQDIFSRMQLRLALHSFPSLSNPAQMPFARDRVLIEHAFRQSRGHGKEITLTEIITLLQHHYGITDKEASCLFALETETELGSVVPIKDILVLINKCRLSGRRIIFLSDMYLPDLTIQDMLQRIGAYKQGDRLYISGSIGKKKSTGELFAFVMEDLGLRSDQIVHVGDFFWSDYLVPRWKHGIRSQMVRYARHNVYELLWGEPCNCLFCSSVSGAMRASRVAKSNEGDQADKALYNIGCDVVGPIMVSFVSWVLQQAAENGIKRLYFLSRDGEIMLEIARELVSRSGSTVDLRYLHVSRTAVFPAMAGVTIDKDSMAWIKEDNIILTPRILADRLKVDVVDLQKALVSSGVLLSEPDLPLSNQAIDEIYHILISHPTVRKLVAESGRSALEKLSGYLEQEGLFDGTACALVDLGWHGSIQDVISTCFNDRLGRKGLTGYYFGVDRRSNGLCRKFGYLFDPVGYSEYAKYRHIFRVLLELLCSGRQGMTIGYHFSPGTGYTPVSSTIEHSENKDSVTSIRQGVMAFIHMLDVADMETVDYKHVKSQILNILTKLLCYPTPEEASKLGAMRFSADQAGHGVHQVASPFTIRASAVYFSKRSYAGRSVLSSWFFASWTLSRWEVRYILYPLVFFLRLHYVGLKMLRFNKMRLMDSMNRLISNFKGLVR